MRRAIFVAALVTIAAWIYTVRGANSMSSGMPMPGGWEMHMAWMTMGGQSRLAHALMFLTMWTVMMIAMMLPSVMPAVLLHQRLIGSRLERGDAAAGSHIILLAGYFFVWALFGLIAYAIGMALSAAAMRHVSVSLLVPVATGGALIAAGIYQLTRWKRLCLRHCRSPLEFFSRHQIRTRRRLVRVRTSPRRVLCRLLLGPDDDSVVARRHERPAHGSRGGCDPSRKAVAPRRGACGLCGGRGHRGRRDSGSSRYNSRMTKTLWRILADEVATCNCAWGCPCQFNALPTHGRCEALVAVRIREGHYGTTRLDGVSFAAAYWWPGPIHEGNGIVQLAIDEKATPEQRTALLSITSGKEGCTFFEIFASVVSKAFDPVYAPIQFETDREKRIARLRCRALGSFALSPSRTP